MNWLENDLRVLALEIKMKELKKVFNKKYGTEIKGYDEKLERFLSRNLKEEMAIILEEQQTFITSSLSEY